MTEQEKTFCYTNNIIPSHLKEIEKEYNVRILLAVESGSRAWGFESKNSDWDVRFIYVHKLSWYLRIEEQKDVIEHMYEDDVDLVGWELKKALTLLRRSNPSLLEWFHSPKVYYVDDDFAKRISEIEALYFNPVKSMYHYNRIYNKHNEHYLQKQDCSMKRFLYYLRGILACKWIEKYNSIPPVLFSELMEKTVDDEHIKLKIKNLLELKKLGGEYDLTVIDKELMDYSKHQAGHFNAIIGSFRPDISNATADSLDRLLFDIVRKPKRCAIQMYPDYGDALFWDEEGTAVGDADGVYINDNIYIHPLGIGGFRDWYNDWVRETLKHPHCWTNSQWREWWEEGLSFAHQVKELLPDNIDLYYFSINEHVWIVRPEDSDDGGLWNEGEPIRIE